MPLALVPLMFVLQVNVDFSFALVIGVAQLFQWWGNRKFNWPQPAVAVDCPADGRTNG